jgi:hypothetical protein
MVRNHNLSKHLFASLCGTYAQDNSLFGMHGVEGGALPNIHCCWCGTFHSHGIGSGKLVPYPVTFGPMLSHVHLLLDTVPAVCARMDGGASSDGVGGVVFRFLRRPNGLTKTPTTALYK